MKPAVFPTTQIEAIRYFSDEAVAHDFLAGMRWGQTGVTCPHCQSKNVGALSVSHYFTKKGETKTRRVWNCKECHQQFTVKVGTIFEDSPLPLSKWLPAVWMIVNAKNGVSSCEMARSLGVTQKSAWFMLHRIRTAMQDGVFNLAGEVEADETFIGAKARNMHPHKWEQFKKTNRAHMTAVAGLLERNAGDKPSRVNVKIVKNTKRSTVQPNVRENVVAGSAVFTDALLSYEGLSDSYQHSVIDHAVSYVDGKIHTNGLENFWCLLKRTIKGTYVCPAPFHLVRYLDEQATRFNERKCNDTVRFLNTVRRADGRRITYKKLTGKEGGESVG
jgi:transposase-like protein